MVRLSQLLHEKHIYDQLEKDNKRLREGLEEAKMALQEVEAQQPPTKKLKSKLVFTTPFALPTRTLVAIVTSSVTARSATPSTSSPAPERTPVLP